MFVPTFIEDSVKLSEDGLHYAKRGPRSATFFGSKPIPYKSRCRLEVEITELEPSHTESRSWGYFGIGFGVAQTYRGTRPVYDDDFTEWRGGHSVIRATEAMYTCRQICCNYGSADLNDIRQGKCMIGHMCDINIWN